MKRALKAFVIALLLPGTGAAAADLRMQFIPRFNQAPLVFDSLTNQTVAGQKISVTRLDFLMSGIALHRADGTWIGNTNWFACIQARDGRTAFTLKAVPPGNYDRIRFHVGLEPGVNHGNPAQWPAGHPLNPAANRLYWSWSHEYVFAAFEGGWQRADGIRSGYSYHIATDRELMTVELPVALDLAADTALSLGLDVGKFFGGSDPIQLSDATDASHSRMNDILVDHLRGNIETAFQMDRASALPAAPRTPAPVGRVEISTAATPYRFTFSQSFPQPDLPRDNPITVEGVALGSKLFFDGQLSANNVQSCASCHHPRAAFAENRRFSRGARGDIGNRNAMPLLNLAWKNSFFWDGRASTLREQVLQPIQNPIEMHETLSHVVAKISALPDYRSFFTRAFGTPAITSDRIARALEQVLLVQTSFDSKFDRVSLGKEKFSETEQRGFDLFHTEYDPRRGQFGADCFHCHGGALFQSQAFANNGLDVRFRDLGRYNATKRPGDQGQFAVPSLRNVELTAPYMHDGRFRTLEEAVEHYCTGMMRSATLDPNLAKHPDRGIPLSEKDKQALVAFLKTLTDERFWEPAEPRRQSVQSPSRSFKVASATVAP